MRGIVCVERAWEAEAEAWRVGQLLSLSLPPPESPHLPTSGRVCLYGGWGGGRWGGREGRRVNVEKIPSQGHAAHGEETEREA